MPMGKTESSCNFVGQTSRRKFLQAAAGAAVVTPALARAGQHSSSPASRRILACVGAYSSPQGPEGAKGRGHGIYVMEMNPATGALSERELIPNDANPAWLAFDASHAHLYSANEVATFGDGNSGSVSAYAVDRATGHLTLLNTVSSEGAGPAHMSIHPSGKYALVANYAGGTVAVLPIHASGELGRLQKIDPEIEPEITQTEELPRNLPLPGQLVAPARIRTDCRIAGRCRASTPTR